MNAAAPATVRWTLRLGAVVVLAVLLWRFGDGPAAVQLLAQAQPGWLVAAVAALTLQTVLSAQRWRLTAGRLGLQIGPGAALGEYYLAQVVNQTLPGGVLGDAGRAVRSRKAAGLAVAAQAVVFERLAGQMGLLAILVAGLVAALVVPGGYDWPPEVRRGFLGVLMVLAGVPVAAALGLWLWRGLRVRIAGLWRAFAQAVLAREVRGAQAGLSLGTALCNLAAFAFCAQALSVDLPVIAVATLVPVILFAMVLPLSVGGWGLREGAAAVLFPVAGLAASEGLATSVAFGLVFLLASVPGLCVTWMRPNAPVPPGG